MTPWVIVRRSVRRGHATFKPVRCWCAAVVLCWWAVARCCCLGAAEHGANEAAAVGGVDRLAPLALNPRVCTGRRARHAQARCSGGGRGRRKRTSLHRDVDGALLARPLQHARELRQEAVGVVQHHDWRAGSGKQRREELRLLRKRQERGGCHRQVWRKGAAAVPTGARKERRPWKPAEPAAARAAATLPATPARTPLASFFLGDPRGISLIR